MVKLIIDGREVQAREGGNVLQAALDAGVDVPHYCYHPALSVVGSCRLCLAEVKTLNPATGERAWNPRLMPSCQLAVSEGLEVRFNSETVLKSRRQVMEDLLLNHPLDCPVCDQAGECWLQDYSRRHGHAVSRMVEHKNKNPKKDIGPRTLLYQDRCVMCSRCVRFTHEISGTHELTVINRGSKAEIDVFPGEPLDNKLQGNVVDICPVGSLLDKDFLFAQRVWLLNKGASVCPGCATGCTIHVDHNDNRVFRIRPRFNPQVNDWWICDDGRYLHKCLSNPERIVRLVIREQDSPLNDWPTTIRLIQQRFLSAAANSGQGIAVQLSPMMSCEEAWLLASWILKVSPHASMALGDVPIEGPDLHFPVGVSAEQARFTIHAEKCPNRQGVEKVITALGGRRVDREQLWQEMAQGKFAAVWVVGGYLGMRWPSAALIEAAKRVPFLVVQDMFPNPLTETAAVVLPACFWVEREGTFMNAHGLLQPFHRVVQPPEGLWRDGQYLHALAGYQGLYTAERVGRLMAAAIPELGEVYQPPALSPHQH